MDDMTIRQMQEQAHSMAMTKGWWEGRQRHPLELLMLCTTELAEAAEEFRNGRPALYYILDNKDKVEIVLGQDILESCPELKGDQVIVTKTGFGPLNGGSFTWDHRPWNRAVEMKLKPEGWMVELADCIIRIGDMAGHNMQNLDEAVSIKMQYNATREHRHGGKLA